ncbi:MAG: succinate dehydrogenase assembly factor 2 [Steroidobacteraceae bacterium]
MDRRGSTGFEAPGPAADAPAGDGTAGSVPDAARGRLAWRCRRGMQELDILLARYLREQYACASSEERAAFVALLDLPDPLIARYLLGGVTPPDSSLAMLTRRLLGRPA